MSSSYNRTRFNLARYNIPRSEEVWLDLHLTERVDALIATSEKSYLLAAGYETIRTDTLEVSLGHMLRIPGAESVAGC